MRDIITGDLNRKVNKQREEGNTHIEREGLQVRDIITGDLNRKVNKQRE